MDPFLTKSQIARDKFRKHPRTISRWRDAGNFPDPDAKTPSGDDLWRESTVDRYFSIQKNEAA